MAAGTRPPRAAHGTATSPGSLGRRLRLALRTLALLPLAVAVAAFLGASGFTLLAIGGFCTLLGLGVLTALVDADLLRRLGELTTAVGRIRRGELDAAVPARGADEMAGLAGALDTWRLDTLALRHSERQRAAQQRTLTRVQRELDVFADVASREIRTPLRGIEQLVDVLREDLGDALAGESRRHMELLRCRVTRLASLLDALLDYARAGSRPAPREAVDLQELIEAAIGLACPPDVQVLVNGAGGRVSTWREPLQRIVCELLAFAGWRNDERREPVSIDCELGDRELRLVVGDCGPGIAPELYERLLAPFACPAAADPANGVGPGLGVVKKLLDVYGGSIEIRPAGARVPGAAFVVSWPIDAVLLSIFPPCESSDPLAALAGAGSPPPRGAAVGRAGSAPYTASPR